MYSNTHFPRLTAGLGGCAYYYQCLTVVTVLLVCTLSSLGGVNTQLFNLDNPRISVNSRITVDREIFVLNIIRGLNFRVKIFCRLTVP